MQTIINTYHLLQQTIHNAEITYHRPKNSVTLIAVSKNQSIDFIRAIYSAGQTRFAENYVQEALKKQALLQDLNIEWHFIGNIQANKTKLMAAQFDWVQSVNRLDTAERLNAQRPPHLPPLNICIEVNIDESQTKSGVSANSIFELAEKIMSLKQLTLRGLMVIPEKNHARKSFEKAAELQKMLISKGFLLDTLSMGMSADFELAIELGSTMVRIGSALHKCSP